MSNTKTKFQCPRCGSVAEAEILKKYKRCGNLYFENLKNQKSYLTRYNERHYYRFLHTIKDVDTFVNYHAPQGRDFLDQ